MVRFRVTVDLWYEVFGTPVGRTPIINMKDVVTHLRKMQSFLDHIFVYDLKCV